jgi:hypothetical protein
MWTAAAVWAFLLAGMIADTKHSSLVPAIGIGMLLTYFVAPGIVSGRAVRFYFWYGLLPLALMIFVVPVAFLPVFIVADHIVHFTTSGTSSHASLRDLVQPIIESGLVCWLISSGTVSLVRYSKAASKARAAKRIAELEAAMAVQIEGSWPPKPKANPSPDSYPFP